MTARLDDQPWMRDPATQAVIAALQAAGGADAARFVGGCVRDALLGRVTPGMDIDIATPLTPPQVIAALGAAGLRAVPTGVEHGTVTAISDRRPFEITTLRRDVETDGRRAVVAFTADWGEDAARRDFRLNALYADADGQVFDPTGEGVADALAGRIVFVGDAARRLREDYLRALRFFRFRAWYGRGEPDAQALSAIEALTAGLAGLSGERVSKELIKLLAAADPREAVRSMRATGAMAVLLPQVDDGGEARLARMVAIDHAQGFAADGELRLAALLPSDSAAVAQASARLRLSNAQRDRLLATTAEAPPLSAAMSPQALRAAAHTLGRGALGDRLRLLWAGEGADAERDAWRALWDAAQAFTPPRFPLTGADLKAVGLAQGPALGEARRELEAWWVAQDFAPDRVKLLERLVRERLAQPDPSSPRS